MIPGWGWIVIGAGVGPILVAVVLGMTGLDDWIANRWRNR